MLIAIGVMFTSASIYEFVGALAPNGQEGLFLEYSNLPLAIGAQSFPESDGMDNPYGDRLCLGFLYVDL